MTTTDDLLSKFRKAYESGIWNKEDYEAAVKGLGIDIKDAQAGVIGDNATVEGGIQHGDQFDIDAGGDVVFAKDKGVAVKIENIIPLNQPNEKIGNIAYDEKTGWSTLWNILSKGKAEYKKNLEEINRITYGDPLEIARYYIEPDCQDVNPADHHSEQDFASKSPALKTVNQFFQSPVFYRGDNHLFILSDAGMGKTALLTMLKLMDLTVLWPRQKDCVLKKLGKETLSEIEKIKSRSGTILLLDSLDEDPVAYGKVRERLLEILRATKDFFRVVITCRTQFFPRVEDDPLRRPGFFKIEEFTCHAKYLSLFSDEKVEQYLDKRFPKKFFFWKDKKKIVDAQTVISKMGYLRCRPMLLSYIENLMTSPLISPQSSEYHVYDALVQSWLAREKEKIPDISEENLFKACVILATIMQIRGWRSIREKDLDQLIGRMKDVLPVKQIDLKGRSLINRNSEGDYRFSHYSIQEFCIARLVLEKPEFTPRGNIPVTDFIFRQIAKSLKKLNFVEKLDFRGLNFSTPALRELLKGLKLPGADLKEKDFSGADLSNADLSSANLSNCRLTGTVFKNAHLKGAKFEGSDFWNADFEGAQIESLPRIRNDPGMEFVFIPPGTFMMGSPKDEPGRIDDEILHRVTLTKGFFMQTTQVTQKQWKSVMGNNPSRFKDCDDCPVEQVSWDDVQEFIVKLNQKTDQKHRLPTEAQWEYGCRAGTSTPFHTGRCLSSTDQANYNGNYSFEGCPKGKYREKTVPVAGFPTNAWGLYDMHGNVWEWCQDWYGEYPAGFRVTNPEGPSTGSYRVTRGGGWSNFAVNCRSAFRNSNSPISRRSDLGFRLVLSPGQQVNLSEL